MRPARRSGRTSSCSGTRGARASRPSTPGTTPRGTTTPGSRTATTVRTYRAGHRLSTERPARSRVAGLDGRDLPGTSRAYHPRTNLPANSLVETFVHPAGYCQNVLATGACRVVGAELVQGREAIVVESLHPRTIEMAGDRPDHRLVLAVDRETGLVARLEERFGAVTTRLVTATEMAPDTPIPDSAFTLAIPATAATIY